MRFMGLGTSAKPRSEALKDEEIQKLIEDRDAPLNSEYLKGKIIDEHEDLYFKRLRRKFSTLVLILLDAATAALLIVAAGIPSAGLHDYWPETGGALAVLITLTFAISYGQHKSIRYSLVRIRKLNVAHRANRRDLEHTERDDDLLAEHKQYREELPEVIADYRTEANRYRRWHNAFQGVIIVGSVVTSAITTASVSYTQARWVAVAVSAVVGLSAGFTGYFKYRERSYNLQQTADAIEREYESVELRVRRYQGLDEKKAYAEFANFVEILRDEQAKRQQQLDQPTEQKSEQKVAQ